MTKIFILTYEILCMARLNLDILRSNEWFFVMVMVITVISIICPVLAAEGSVAVSYRGAGGYTIGEVIIFDGRDTVGNTTLLKISGPGLPEAGVPLYDLNGISGSGNTIPVNADGIWKFVWDTSNTAGIDKLMTVRYTITAFDQAHPEKTASTSILLKKPGFYVNSQPGVVNTGDYAEVSGSAEQGITYVKIEIVNPEGGILHTFISPVSGTGFFDYGFRVDMQPGWYTVRVSNPALKDIATTIVTVVSPETHNAVISTPTIQQETTPVLTVNSPEQTTPVISGTSVTPSIPLSSLTLIFGLVVSGVIAIATGSRKQ
jgi:hypothetical protein